MTFPLLRRPRTVIAAVSLAAATALGASCALPADAHTRPVRLTAAARQAGLEPGNATMGWRQKQQAGLQRASVQQRAGASPMTTRTFTPTGILGIDVASYQGTVNWTRWVASGRSFAYVKATEGTSYRNPYFSSQYLGSYWAGMIRGAYHFAIPNGASGRIQADYFVRHGGGWSADGRTLPGVLDIEYNPYGSTCYGLSKPKMVSWISDFTREYKRLTTRDAVIYTTTDWWSRCTGNTTKFTYTNPLWAARYGTTDPGTLPGGWRTATFWQYTWTPVDQDRFSANRGRLSVLAYGR